MDRETRLWKAVRKIHQLLCELISLIRESGEVQEAFEEELLLRFLYVAEDLLYTIEDRWSVGYC